VKINGVDPDFHRRDMWDAIQRGDYPEWELGVQIFDDALNIRKNSSSSFAGRKLGVFASEGIDVKICDAFGHCKFIGYNTAAETLLKSAGLADSKEAGFRDQL